MLVYNSVSRALHNHVVYKCRCDRIVATCKCDDDTKPEKEIIKFYQCNCAEVEKIAFTHKDRDERRKIKDDLNKVKRKKKNA